MKILFIFFLLVNVGYFYYQSEGQENKDLSTLHKQPALAKGVDPLILLRERGLGGTEKLTGDSSQSKTELSERRSKNDQHIAPLETTKQAAARPVHAALPVQAERQAGSKQSPEDVTREPASSKAGLTTTVDKTDITDITDIATEAACFTFGPFAKEKTASRASKAIRTLGLDVVQRIVSQRTPKGYWVYLPASKSYQAAKRKVKQLQKKGLKDLFIMGKGSRKNAISLGLFKRRTAAQARFKQIKKLGLKAVFETQYRVNKQTWMDMSVAGSETSTVAKLVGLAEKYPKPTLTQRKCQ